MDRHSKIYSKETLIRTIREYGIIPFFHGKIPGWSIEELTDPECWFTSSEELGPWDWKIDAVREGDIAYGKFISGKAAFATVDYFRHLMNWRRNLTKYQFCPDIPQTNCSIKGELLIRALSPSALNSIIENGTCSMNEIRTAIEKSISPELLLMVAEELRPRLTPSVKKNIVDSIMQYLEMGTWTVIGDFTRIYKGPNLEYTGWQRSSHTTPESLFGTNTCGNDNAPFWVKLFERDCGMTSPLLVDCSPEESLDILTEHIMTVSRFGDKGQIIKIIR